MRGLILMYRIWQLSRSETRRGIGVADLGTLYNSKLERYGMTALWIDSSSVKLFE